MNSEDSKSSDALQARVNAEMIDSFDQELEMELDDERLSDMLASTEEYQRYSRRRDRSHRHRPGRYNS